MSVENLVVAMAQGIALILVAPLSAGLLRYLQAVFQRRRRPLGTVWQPYRDLIKLLQIPAMRSHTASWVFAWAPITVFVAYGLLAFVVPIFSTQPLLTVDLIFVVYLLGLARFALSLAGLDSGAPFGALGSSREMFLHFMTEVGLVLVLAGLALLTGTITLGDLFLQQRPLGPERMPELVLLAISFLILILFEAERMPIGNPTTHLELTMNQKAVVLEYAGVDLALVEWAEMIKLAALLSLFIALFVPNFNILDLLLDRQVGHALTMGLGYLIKMAILLGGLALWEAWQPKLRLRQIRQLSLLAMVISLTAIAIYLIISVVLGRS
jgi:formate hydrogenlyase subunit 4